jgi:hypothetical protein
MIKKKWTHTFKQSKEQKKNKNHFAISSIAAIM